MTDTQTARAWHTFLDDAQSLWEKGEREFSGRTILVPPSLKIPLRDYLGLRRFSERDGKPIVYTDFGWMYVVCDRDVSKLELQP